MLTRHTRNNRPLRQPSNHARGVLGNRPAWFAAIGATLALAAAIPLSIIGCADQNGRMQSQPAAGGGVIGRYVVSLGNLRGGQPPTPTAIKLSQFFFGADPEAPIGLVKPVDLAVLSDGVVVSDSALRTVLKWSASPSTIDFAAQLAPGRSPNALSPAPNGELLVADLSGDVSRVAPNGSVLTRYAAPDSMRPGGAACVGQQVWITNLHHHRIDVFDRQTGAFQKSIGKRGRGNGEFGLPLGLAVTPDGDVCVADMLNARVQVLDSQGAWKMNIGGPGDRIGYFGRPKDVAVGPDGTVFVTDAATQQVNAFDRNGRALIAFGGPADGRDALVLPAGIAVSPGPITSDRIAPSGFNVAYYVLVAEQLSRPGIRVYAWSGRTRPAPEDVALAPQKARARAASVANPHWTPDGCKACHGEQSQGSPAPIAADRVDALCVSCHDGKQAIDEFHPIGISVTSDKTHIPADRPLVNGRLGCATCHDIRSHCTAAGRPADNPVFVRGYYAFQPFSTCNACHAEGNWRVSPHQSQSAVATNSASGCRQCHVSAPKRRDDGTYDFDSSLRVAGVGLCLGCHQMHADPAPDGHLGKRPEQMAFSLPLDNGAIYCATCHNPHAPDAEPAAVFSAAGRTRSTSPVDEKKAIRLEYKTLCRNCHLK
ncbi:MAG: hypothetical protein HZB38_10380 [Planctomycetes bacterium]|nr:hypothetical protein [Planctomycetota bacterium]